LNDDRVIDSAFLQSAKKAIIIKEHFSKEVGMSRQLGCINLEPLALNLEKTNLILIIIMGNNGTHRKDDWEDFPVKVWVK
jgi:hypothetical protein